jgi:hypothetical protein
MQGYFMQFSMNLSKSILMKKSEIHFWKLDSDSHQTAPKIFHGRGYLFGADTMLLPVSYHVHPRRRSSVRLENKSVS